VRTAEETGKSDTEAVPTPAELPDAAVFCRRISAEDAVAKPCDRHDTASRYNFVSVAVAEPIPAEAIGGATMRERRAAWAPATPAVPSAGWKAMEGDNAAVALPLAWAAGWASSKSDSELAAFPEEVPWKIANSLSVRAAAACPALGIGGAETCTAAASPTAATPDEAAAMKRRKTGPRDAAPVPFEVAVGCTSRVAERDAAPCPAEVADRRIPGKARMAAVATPAAQAATVSRIVAARAAVAWPAEEEAANSRTDGDAEAVPTPCEVAAGRAVVREGHGVTA
jgi:hypothetical protein